MVTTLWRQRNVLAALALETLGSELVERRPVSIYCAYPSSLVPARSADTEDATCRFTSIHSTGINTTKRRATTAAW